MTSPEGGRVSPDNATLLLNEKATFPNMIAALEWLIDQTKEGETVIFYFAGHGDLENKTMFQNGFLLANDCPKSSYMAGGALPVIYLQQYSATLVQKNKAKVIIITDACKSGKLAGGLEGITNTTTALQQSVENTVKILSSQPGELSYESDKWNGGAGVFTYYLVKGMMGFADRNNDKKITVGEINIYLTDKIPAETNFAQNPSVIGNPAVILSVIDSITFANLKKMQSNEILTNGDVAFRGFEDDLKKQLDSSTYKMYMDFRFCITNNYLTESHPVYGNAVELYKKLLENKNASLVHSPAKRSLIAALQNTTQITINCLLEGKESPNEFSIPKAYKELGIAYSMTDSTEISYNSIKCRYLFVKSFNSFDSNNFKEGFQNIEALLNTDPDFSPAYFIKGIANFNMGNFDIAAESFLKAVELSPNWMWAYKSAARTLFKLKKSDEAVALINKGLKINPDYGPIHSLLIDHYYRTKDTVLALEYLEKWDSIATNINPDVMQIVYVGDLYRDLFKDSVKAFETYMKAIKTDPENADVYLELMTLSVKDEKNYKIYLNKYVEYKQKELNALISNYPNHIDHSAHVYHLAETYAIAGDIKNALIWYEEFIQYTSNPREAESNDWFKEMILTKEYKNLVKKYKKQK